MSHEMMSTLSESLSYPAKAGRQIDELSVDLVSLRMGPVTYQVTGPIRLVKLDEQLALCDSCESEGAERGCWVDNQMSSHISDDDI